MEEGERMAQASLKLASFYGVGGISPQLDAWLKFGSTAGAIYGPRVLGTMMKPAATSAQRPPPVHTMSGSADGTAPLTGIIEGATFQ